MWAEKLAEEIGMADTSCCEQQECPVCELCGALENLKVCARCKGTWYCSKEHQASHWKEHKRACKKAQLAEDAAADPGGRGPGEGGATSQAHSQNTGDVCGSARTQQAQEDAKSNMDGSDNMAAEASGSRGKGSRGRRKGAKKQQEQVPAPGNAAAGSGTKSLGDYVVQCLNDYGLCVVDSFLGEETCMKILGEVKCMQENGEMCDGELVNKLEPVKKVRGDKIAWTEKGDEGRASLSVLIQKLDNLVMSCSRRFGQYVIGGRTKVTDAR